MQYAPKINALSNLFCSFVHLKVIGFGSVYFMYDCGFAFHEVLLYNTTMLNPLKYFDPDDLHDIC